MTKSKLFIYEYEELIYLYNLEKDFSKKFLITYTLLDEDEFLYIGSDKLNIIDLYTDEIQIYLNTQRKA